MNNIKTIYLGGGCFWCTEAVFDGLEGVEEIIPGYAGGETKNPTYEQVCSGQTGHAEVVRLKYNEEKINLEKILDIFLESHDPTSLNKQGNDIGTQYRSAIYFKDKDQERIIKEFLNKKQSQYSKPIVTEVGLIDNFYEAEKYHWKYFKKNPEKAYCQLVIVPKVRKIKKKLNK